MKSYTVVGYYGKRNCGDDAFTFAIPRLLPPGSSVKFVHGSPPKDGSTLILGGGEVINDYFLDRMPKGRPFHILGAGIPYESMLPLLENHRVNEAVFRTRLDTKLAQEAGHDAYYAPDVTFVLDVPEGEGPVLPPKKSEKKYLGIMYTDKMNFAAREDMKNAAYGLYLKQEIAETIYALSEWYIPVFIPMSDFLYDYDVRSLLDILSFVPLMKGGKGIDHVVLPYLGVQRTMKAISELDTLLTMRFHGLMFAVNVGTPVVNIGCTKKMVQFCREEGLERISVEPYTYTTDRCLAAVKAAEDERMRESLLTISGAKKRQLATLKQRLATW